MKIVRIQDVEKRYGDKVVFSNVNLEVCTGSFMVLYGESGVGKSTLLNLIGGLEVPTSGRIVVDGKDVNKMRQKERVDFYRHKVGIVFQGSYLQPQFTLLENITLPGVFAGMNRLKRNERAELLAEMLGVSDILQRSPSEVSGGQAERACIARALLLKPKIILADEPTSNLDEKNARAILELLDWVRRQTGATVIIASHAKEALEFATQKVEVKGGKVKEDDA